MIDIFFAIGANLNVNVEAKFLNNMPNITGTVTIKNISSDILIKEISSAKLESFNKLTENERKEWAFYAARISKPIRQ